ncbi:MAG TPA: RNA-binding domain-containing protein [Candidatus Sericytochromatia bacterium]
MYDFKQGFTKLDGRGEFDQDSFNKIIKTLTAMANHSPNSTGYVCVGVADNDNDAKRVENIYDIQLIEYKGFKIAGIEHEATRLQGSVDKFFRWLIQKVESQPIDQSVKTNIGKDIRLVNYHRKDIVLFRLSAGRDPTAYDGKYYQRIGANVQEIKFAEYGDLFRRFTQA